MDYVVHNALDRLRSRSMCHEFVSSTVEDHFRTTRKTTTTTTTTTAASSFPPRHRRWAMRTCDPVAVVVAAVDCGDCYCLDTTTGAFWRAIGRIVDYWCGQSWPLRRLPNASRSPATAKDEKGNRTKNHDHLEREVPISRKVLEAAAQELDREPA